MDWDDEADECDLAQRLRQALSGAVLEAVARLRGVARGEGAFRNDHELRACVALARMAGRVVVAAGDEAKPYREPFHPDHTQEEVEKLLCVLTNDPEEAAERARAWAESA